MNLLMIISVDFIIIGKLLIEFLAFSKYYRRNVCWISTADI